MSAKFTFVMHSEDRHRALPHKVIIGRNETETVAHVTLKFLSYAIFYRERLLIETNLHNEQIPFVPDLVQLDYELRPGLWIECGECTLSKLRKLAAKAPGAEIWVVKRNEQDARHLLQAMEKEDLRQGRYQILGLDAGMFREVAALTDVKNEVTWYRGEFEPPRLQFEYNGIWFDTGFTHLKH